MLQLLLLVVHGVKPISNHVCMIPHISFLAFDEKPIVVPIAPSLPLCLDSVSFRNDKNIFLTKKELEKVVSLGRKKPNLNPNRNYNEIILLPEKNYQEV